MGAAVQQALMFIVQFLFGLYSFMIVLRLWVRLSRVSERNFLLEGIGKTTNPIVNVLRKCLPDIGRLELGSLVLLLLVTFIKLVLVSLISGHFPQSVGLLAWTLMSAIEVILDAIFYVMILLAILSWIPTAQPVMLSLLTQITMPLLMPIRRFVPLFGGMDLSPVVLLVLVQLVEILLINPLMRSVLMMAFR